MSAIRHEFTRNQAMQCASHLVVSHGFEVDEVFPSQLVKVVDYQHALLVDMEPGGFLDRKDVAVRWWGLSFGVARRDINERVLEWSSKPARGSRPWIFGTIRELPRNVFVTDSPLNWHSDVSFDTQIDAIDAAIGDLGDWATLEMVESQLYRSDPPFSVDRVKAINDALNGNDRSTDEYVLFRDRLANSDKPKPREAIAIFDQHLQAFRAEHPNGIGR